MWPQKSFKYLFSQIDFVRASNYNTIPLFQDNSKLSSLITSIIQSNSKHLHNRLNILMLPEASRTNLYKNIRKQITTTLYGCDCGKTYETFPALYLHCKRKHSQRISAKSLLKQQVIEECGSFKINKSFHGSSSFPYQNEGLHECSLAQILDKFITETKGESESRQVCHECLYRLVSFVEKKLRGCQQSSRVRIMENIYSYMNLFMVQESEKLEKGGFEVWSETLIRLSHWLYAKKLSGRVIEKNEKYEIKQKR